MVICTVQCCTLVVGSFTKSQKVPSDYTTNYFGQLGFLTNQSVVFQPARSQRHQLSRKEGQRKVLNLTQFLEVGELTVVNLVSMNHSFVCCACTV